MPRISYLPDEKSVEVEEGDFILESSKQAGIPHTHVCGGAARCSTCRILVLDGLENCSDRNSAECAIAEKLRFEPSIRLACQTQVLGDITVRRLAIDQEDIELIHAQIRGNISPESIGQEKKVAILFADLRGFTSLSEKLLPYDVIYLLNRYFLHMGEVIDRHGGVINNYMGDGLMALFGLDDAESAAERAVSAGLDMIDAIEKINPHIEMLYRQKLRMGIGINYGGVVIGEVGAIDNRRLTAIGDAVNLASRIESANKDVGTTLLISETTYEEIRDSDHLRVNRHERVNIKGKSGQYTLYEVLEFTSTSEQPKRDRFTHSRSPYSQLLKRFRRLFQDLCKALTNLFSSFRD
jgi:adenylate cyclase